MRKASTLHASAIVDEVFADLRDHLVAHSPTTATRMGDHHRDGDLDDWGAGAVDERLRQLSIMRRRLEDLEPGSLDEEADGDRRMVCDTLDSMRLELVGLRLPETDPTFYLGIATAGVYDLLRRDDLAAEPRRAAAASRAAQVPRLLEQARANLAAIPAPHREVALLRAPGAAALFREALPEFAPEAGQVGAAAAAACEDFGSWLTDGGDDAAIPGWRLGEDRWGDALGLALGVRMEPDEVWQRAERRLEELQADAESLAARVLAARGRGWPAGTDGRELVRAALDVVAADHAPRERLVPDAAGVLHDIVAFLDEVQLFDLPDVEALRVEEVPAFQQGVAVAYFMPAPPLEPDAPHTYYLSPVPDEWDDDRARSFLREYNRHALCSVGIHEAYPGHYAHFAAAQRHPRLLRRALWNSACAEGWAVYVEREVVRAGFGGPDLALTSAKMDMRAVANALLDQGLHVRGWDDDTAMELMVERAYQEPSEAAGKLVRAKVTAGQLSTYFVGGEEMADLRADVAAARDGSFDVRGFHRDVLAQGVPPVSVLRRALLGRGERSTR